MIISCVHGGDLSHFHIVIAAVVLQIGTRSYWCRRIVQLWHKLEQMWRKLSIEQGK